MNELKIDEELRDLLPPLSIDEKEQLEKNLVKNGYIGSPIYTWNGYIVDGHNRYEVCTKHNIEFVSEELSLGKDSTKTDVMEWMINTQLGRRNLILAQRLIVVEKFKARIKEEAKQNQSEFKGNQYQKVESSPNGEKSKKIHTDKELAKIAGVGNGTIGRWNQVQKFADEELKQKVSTGEVTINKAYEIVKGDGTKELEKETHDSEEDKTFLNNISEICKDVKSLKNIEDCWNFLNEIECIEENISSSIEDADCVLFEERQIEGKITEEEKNIALSYIEELSLKLESLKNKIKNTKIKGDN